MVISFENPISLMIKVLKYSVKISSFGKSTDQSSSWTEKLQEVRETLFHHLPFEVAVKLFDLYKGHVNARRGLNLATEQDFAYRKLIEFEETLLEWEELRVSNLSSCLCKKKKCKSQRSTRI